MSLATFFDSPSNRTAVCLFIGAIPGAATIILSGSPKQIAIALVIGQGCGVLAKILQPDNTQAIAQSAAVKAVAATAPPAPPTAETDNVLPLDTLAKLNATSPTA